MYRYIKKVSIYSSTCIFILLSLVGFSTAHAGCSTANMRSQYCSPGGIIKNGYTTISYSSNVILSSPYSSPANSLISVLWNAKVSETKTTTVVQPVIGVDCTIEYYDYTFCTYATTQQGATTSSSSASIPVGTISILSPDLPNQQQCTASVANGVSSCYSPAVIKPGTYHYLARFTGTSSSSTSNTITLIEEPNSGFLVPILTLIEN